MNLAPAQLEWAWLSKVHFEADPEFLREDISKAAYELKRDSEILTLGQGEDGGMWAFVKVAIEVDWTRTDEADGPYPFELSAEVTGMFQWSAASTPKTERMARLWLEYNGIYLLWPYLRTYVAAITGMSDLPPLTIYTMRVPDRPELDEDDDETAEPAAERASG